jgi:RNA polymerase sigma-70 factor (ECF subfamily)
MTTARPGDIFREARPGVTPSPELDLALARVAAEGRAVWPEVAVADEDFVRYLAARVAEGEDVVEALGALHTADLYLACGCSAGSPAAVEAFTRRLLGDVDAVLQPVGAAALAEDVRQILLERLFVGSESSPPKIGTYSGRGPLAAWVRVSAVRVAVSLRRSERAADSPLADDDLGPLAGGVDPELDALKLRYAAVFNAALRDAFAALPPRDRTLLKLHYVDGVRVERIASSYNAHRVSVSRWLSAARARVLEETTRLLRERQRLSESECRSLARLLESRLTVSLRSAVGEGRAG